MIGFQDTTDTDLGDVFTQTRYRRDQKHNVRQEIG